MIIYFLTFYLFYDIKKYRNHSCESICNVKCNFDKNARATWTSIFSILRFALGIIHDDRCDRKNTNNNCFIQVKPPFLVVEVSNTVTFWRNARVDVILTSVTIIKQVFLCKLLCYESLVDIEVSKHKKHLIIDTSYSLGSSDVITNVKTMTLINPFIILRK